MRKDSTTGGFAALLALLLGVVIIAFIIIQQYGGFQFFDRQATLQRGDGTSSGIRAPIDKAREAKEMLENRTRESQDL
jgi:hypothetical protein